MSKSQPTVSTSADEKLDEIIKLMQLSNCISMYQAGASQEQIAKTLAFSKTKVNKMLMGIPKPNNKAD